MFLFINNIHLIQIIIYFSFTYHLYLKTFLAHCGNIVLQHLIKNGIYSTYMPLSPLN